jgi:hypothetical protein
VVEVVHQFDVEFVVVDSPVSLVEDEQIVFVYVEVLPYFLLD